VDTIDAIKQLGHCSGHRTATVSPVQVKSAAERKRTGKIADDKRFKIFGGSANKALCEEVCRFVGVPVGETRMQRFSDGEIHFQLLENVRGADVFLVQPNLLPGRSTSRRTSDHDRRSQSAPRQHVSPL